MKNWREDIVAVRGALRRFGHRMVTNKRLLTLMVIATGSLFAVVILYLSDPRLVKEPWHTYGEGLFSINEGRDDHFDEFKFSGDFGEEVQRKGGGQLLGAYQKTILTETGDIKEFIHINVFDLSALYSHMYSSETAVSDKYLSASTPFFADKDIQRIPDIHGHPALVYKSHTRDDGGYYAMGVVVCAHLRAYYYERYCHFSPYADWQNDPKTYYFIEAGGFPSTFTVDDMSRMEDMFFAYSLLLYFAFVMAGVLAFRMITRGIIHQGPNHPIINFEAQRRFQVMTTFTIVLLVVMFIMLIAFWQYPGTKTVQSAAYIVLGLILLSFNLPTLIHLYKKARGRLPQQRETTQNNPQ